MRLTDRNRPLGILARVALLVAAVDLLTKAAASRVVDGEIVLTEGLRLAVVHNDAAAFGWSIGAYTWQLNLALTLGAIVFIIPVSRELARVDAMAPRALGLIVGGALGNLASLVSSPQGVLDFISVAVGSSTELVLNVADLAAYLGLALIARTAFLIVAELRRVARPIPLALADVPGVRSWRARGAEAELPVMPDREVPVPVYGSDLEEAPGPVKPPPRPESVRLAEQSDGSRVAKVIDIRPHLHPPRPGQAESLRVD